MVKQMLDPDDAFLQLDAQTLLAMRIGMLIWLDYCDHEFAWDKWDVQGNAIPIWADLYSEIMVSKKRPSEAILTDVDTIAAFQSAIRCWASAQLPGDPRYQCMGDDLKGTDLACWHFNDEDGCSIWVLAKGRGLL
ncbi:hypothetical protein C8R44DRAFT_729127 [Mycena epipterygia]|nr:hypothetical protein C8R44DRAFT_729127 [Mycena epipterygia]